MKTNVVVEFADLSRIGHTIMGENGKLVLLCSQYTANIEHILLRNILAIKGYSIVSVDDFIWNNGDVSVQFTTDMPYSEFELLSIL